MINTFLEAMLERIKKRNLKFVFLCGVAIEFTWLFKFFCTVIEYQLKKLMNTKLKGF